MLVEHIRQAVDEIEITGPRSPHLEAALEHLRAAEAVASSQREVEVATAQQASQPQGKDSGSDKDKSEGVTDATV